ncbi:PorT family protein [Flavobacterium phycosphaerae]|uniref:PorT family protein n=1 Tax=Flavobacterium phycosphaerae TaxID=2697515 RepID=UPI001389F16C|nr:PorT family protein [Flavobacterium phycosphaerae]
MKKYFGLLLLFFSFQLFAQKNFVKGYFIDNGGKRTECLINNANWDSNPDEIEYKLTESDIIKKATILEVKEVGAENEYSFKRFDVDISKSQAKVLTDDRNFIYERKTVYLKEIITGNATLYSYFQDGRLKFFFSYDNKLPIQLEYKEFKFYNEILTNNNYKQQLFNSLKNGTVTESDIANLEYKSSSLIAFFIKYNGLDKNQANSNKKVFKGKVDYNLYVKAGIQKSSFSANSHNSYIGDFKFKDATDLRYEVEFEMILPVSNKSWSIFVDAYTITYKDELTRSFGKVVFEYQTIEIPLGVRYYFSLNDKSKLFINLGPQFAIPLKSDFKMDQFQDVYGNFNYPFNFHYGIGFNFNNKFSLAINSMTKRNLMEDKGWDTNFKNYSLTLGYNLF